MIAAKDQKKEALHSGLANQLMSVALTASGILHAITFDRNFGKWHVSKLGT
jgi:hypothetical protein